MHFLYIAAVLSLLSVSSAAPLQCEDLLQPLVLEDISPILGKWAVVEATVDSTRFDALAKIVNGSWMETVPTHHKDTAFVKKAHMINGVCLYETTNVTISNNVLQFDMEVNVTGNSTATLLQTCADCLVLNGHAFYDGLEIRTLHLFGRTGVKLSDSDRETYRRQVECLALPKSKLHYEDQQELCADKTKNIHAEESSEGKPEQDKSD
ncbi:hypothetical protein SKAU_G00124810 [Synaphobranchus kaupii]|uniref:Saxitoxin and tetrodotoxin-binding protein 1-like n=1 Tax=Synaphobranchus kaupii TaxID=118154 RepID=A0A9Q1J2W1_SYNKA|nr:hypothetical protein SKAU_G00124810 [Synaphobranchus kaupii]